MIPRGAINVIDNMLRDFMEKDLPFGGKLLVLGGDFRQVLPVVPYAGPEQVVGETLQYTNAWRSGVFKVKSLSQNMRVALAGGQNSD